MVVDLRMPANMVPSRTARSHQHWSSGRVTDRCAKVIPAIGTDRRTISGGSASARCKLMT